MRPDDTIGARKITSQTRQKHSGVISLFHPDYTVGIGISPIRERQPPFFADFTAGEEFHLAPKLFLNYIVYAWNCQAKETDLFPFHKRKDDVKGTALAYFTVHTKDKLMSF